VIKNQDKNHKNEKATPQKAHIESIADLAPTFSTASANIGNQRLVKQIAEGRANPETNP